MAQYIEISGEKHVQFDDGTTAPVTLVASPIDGLKVTIEADDLAALQTPTLPSEYALPAAQVTALQSVSVGNFPASFNIGNFPASYSVANMPSVFPLSAGQEAILSAINANVAAFDTDGGVLSNNTLRVVYARESYTPARSAVASSTNSTELVAASTSRKFLWLHNDSIFDCRIGAGTATVSASNFTDRIEAGGRLILEGHAARMAWHGQWTNENGSMRITEGS